MNIEDIKKNAFSMPISSPYARRATPHIYKNREYFVIQYETDLDILRAVVPEPLKVVKPVVNFEFMRMPDAYGSGSFAESGQVIEVEFEGKLGIYSHAMYVSSAIPVIAGREVWGFPKKLANPQLAIETDTLTGTLHYNSEIVARGTMGYKQNIIDKAIVENKLSQHENFTLKVIPEVDGQKAALCQLVRFYIQDITVHGAWSSEAVALQFFEHALAPVANLPIKKIISGQHFIADLTLGFGEVVYDYLD